MPVKYHYRNLLVSYNCNLVRLCRQIKNDYFAYLALANDSYNNSDHLTAVCDELNETINQLREITFILLGIEHLLSEPLPKKMDFWTPFEELRDDVIDRYIYLNLTQG